MHDHVGWTIGGKQTTTGGKFSYSLNDGSRKSLGHLEAGFQPPHSREKCFIITIKIVYATLSMIFHRGNGKNISKITRSKKSSYDCYPDSVLRAGPVGIAALFCRMIKRFLYMIITTFDWQLDPERKHPKINITNGFGYRNKIKSLRLLNEKPRTCVIASKLQ